MKSLKRYWSTDASAACENSPVFAAPIGSKTGSALGLPLNPGVLLIALAILFLGGCGGTDETTAEPTSAIEGVTDKQLDAAVEQTKNRVKDALKVQGLGSETAKGGYAVGGERDGESFSVGVDLDTPAWLPSEFPLPDDLSIAMVTTDKEGSSELRGRSASVKQSRIAELAVPWAASHNWEVVLSTDEMMTLANSDGQVLDVRADDGADLELRLSRRDLTAERQQAAVERKGSGSADITMAGDTWTVQGECLIKGSSYQFDYSASDGSVYTSVQIQGANSTPTGSATFMTNAAGQFNQFNINFPMNNDNEPVVTGTEHEFSVSGTFFSMAGGGVAAVDGKISVDCEF